MELGRNGKGMECYGMDFGSIGSYILISAYFVGMNSSFFCFGLILNIILFFTVVGLGNIIIIIIIIGSKKV
ncbi:MAG: hypothetical protein ACI90V_010480 [Bacillariaceae sp.]|jgi:hypothetical protein